MPTSEPRASDVSDELNDDRATSSINANANGRTPAPDATGDWCAELEAAKRGDADALGALLERTRRYLMLVAQRELSPALRAKAALSDVVQDTFCAAQQGIASFVGDSPEQFLAWLQAILSNQIATTVRRYRGADKRCIDRESPLPPAADDADDHPLTDGQPTPSSVARNKEEVAALAAALARLPERYRRILQLRDYERLSFVEIGERLGRSADAARKLWGRALLRLQTEFDHDGARANNAADK